MPVHILFPPGQAARHHSDGPPLPTIAPASGRRQGPMARTPGALRTRTATAAPAVPAPAPSPPDAHGRSGRYHLICGTAVGPGRQERTWHTTRKQAADPSHRLICAEFPDLHRLCLDQNRANARADRQGGYFAQVRTARLLSVIVLLSGHALSWQGSRAARDQVDHTVWVLSSGVTSGVDRSQQNSGFPGYGPACRAYCRHACPTPSHRH